jgi:transposase
VIACTEITNDTAGFARLLEWIAEHAPGPFVVAAVEGTRSYGIGLTRALTAAGLQVLECEQPARKDRRGRGKSDAIDAHLAVLFALRQDTTKLPTPRSDGPREALRVLLAARQEMVTTSTGQINRLRALLLSGDDRDREMSRAAFTDQALSRLARRRLPADADRLQAVRHGEIRRLALAVRETTKALKANRRELHELVDQIAPGLTERPGIGPVSAAQVVVSFSHLGRVRNDAAFAVLAGTSPIPASSGQTVRHRLNRGGDRALNRAIHTIAMVRMRSCSRTRAYVARRTAEGKTKTEILRCPQALYRPRNLPLPHQADLSPGPPPRTTATRPYAPARNRLMK